MGRNLSILAVALALAPAAWAAEPVRLVSWNVRGMGAGDGPLARASGLGTETLEAVARRLVDETAGVIALQEVRRPGVASLFVDQTLALGMRLGMGSVGPVGPDGLTLFSRHSILASRVVPLAGDATLVLARIALPGAPAGVWFGTTRLAARDTAERRLQARALADALDGVDGPVLVAISTRGQEPAQWKGRGFTSVPQPEAELGGVAGLPRASRVVARIKDPAEVSLPYLEWFPDDFDARALSPRMP